MKITTTILAPYTGTYTLTFYYDDGADVYLDEVMLMNKFSISSNSFLTTTVNLVAGTYYPFYTKWSEITGGALFTVSWAYGGVSSVQIPTTNQILTPLAGSSPYTFTVVSEI